MIAKGNAARPGADPALDPRDSTYPFFAVGSRWNIRPPNAAPAVDGRIDLVMARGAFGSGEHETTASCLEVLESLPGLAGAQVLDLGSGTGILSIAALKLGASQALCIDVASAAVESAQINCELNGLGDRVQHLAGTLSDCPAKEFDLVLANLYGDVLLGLGADLWQRVTPGGQLLISGMLWEQAYDVRELFLRQGATVLQERWLDEYVTLLLRRRTASRP